MITEEKHGSFSLFGTNILSYYYCSRLGWIGIFGAGIKFKDTKIHPLIFSERYGYTKSIKVGRWYIGWLRKETSKSGTPTS